MLRLIPAPIHRALLRLAHDFRHRYRAWRKQPIIGCSVVVTDYQGSILLLRHSYGPPVWSLPGGGIKGGETPEQAARREVMEELRIELGDLLALGIVEEQISGSPHTSHLFEAVASVGPRPDQREVVDARFFPGHSLPEPQGELTRRRLAIWRERRMQRSA